MTHAPQLSDSVSDRYAPFLSFREEKSAERVWAYRDSRGKLHPIHDVRLLPMAAAALPEEVEPFLTETVPARGGKYYYERHSIARPQGALLLFQYGGCIIGHAVCIGEGQDDISAAQGHGGYYRLLSESIMLYHEPLTAEQMRGLDAGITRLGQGTSHIRLTALPALLHLLGTQAETLRQQILTDERPEEEEDERADFPMMKTKEGKPIETTHRRLERNPRARRECLRYYRCRHRGKIVCEICGFDFERAYGKEFRHMIHVHHLTPLASYEGEHGIIPMTELIPICPNCHAVAHRRTPPYTPDDIRAMLNRPTTE